jgi:CRP/FNR family nitrogen fixation transcriptional regulator
MSWDRSSMRAAEPIWRHQPVPPRQNPVPDPLAAMASAARPLRCGRGRIIYAADSPARYLYRVVSGAAARFLLRSDGRRQIIDLLLPGDVFGFGAGGRHRFNAAAIVDGTSIAGYPRARIDALAAADPRIAAAVNAAMTAAAARLHDLIVILGHTTAEEKVGAFLLYLTRRLSGGSADAVILPFTREDIADYLALSVETVSRSLTLLRRRGAIRLAGSRHVKILDRAVIAGGDNDREAVDNLRVPACSGRD